MTIAIGTPQYGSKKKLNIRLKDGATRARILPPLGTLASEGKWAIFDSIHWGYKGSGGMRPFRCIQKIDFKTKMVKVQCPECDKIAQKKALLEATKKKLEAEGKTPDQIKEFVKPLADWLFSHNLDKKWYMNVVTPESKIGRLAVPHKSYTALQELITELVSKKNIDPIGVEGGVEFDFIRSGSGNQTTHRVAVVMQQMEVDVGGQKMKVEAIKPAPLTEDVISRLATEAFDLSDSATVLTYDQIQMLVSSEGDPEIADQVFGTGQVSRTIDNAGGDEADIDPGAGATLPTLPAAPVMPPPPAPAAAVVPSQADQIAALQAQLAKLTAAPAAPAVSTGSALLASPSPAPTVSAAPAPAPSVANPASMSDADFIKAFGFSAATPGK